MKLEFSQQIFKNNLISNFMKIRPVGAEFFHAGRRTDRQKKTKLVVVFSNFVKAPKMFLLRVLYRQKHALCGDHGRLSVT
jgi:hypothetical protein